MPCNSFPTEPTNVCRLYPDQRAEGEIVLDGENLLTSRKDVALIRARVGMVFQKPTPFPMSIYDNIAFGVRLFEKLRDADMDDRVEWALRKAALWDEVKDKLNQSGSGLSGGQQQRLCIARGIAIKPDVLLLDEPCSALDPISTGKIEELITELKKDYTVVIVTHNMQQAARVSDYTAYMYLGDLVEWARPSRSSSSPSGRRPRTTSPAGSAEGRKAVPAWRTSTFPPSSTANSNALSSRVMEMGGLVESQIRQAIQALGAIQRRRGPPGDRDRGARQPDGSGDRPRAVLGDRAAPADGARPAPADGDLQDHRQPRARGRRGRAHRPHGAVHRGEERRRAHACRPGNCGVAADLASAQLRKALDAFARLDTAAAVAIMKEDDLLDREFDGFVRKLITYMMEDPRTISSSLDLLFVAKAIERIGDHAKNIAEFIIYVVKGADVRHSSMEHIESAIR